MFDSDYHICVRISGDIERRRKGRRQGYNGKALILGVGTDTLLCRALNSGTTSPETSTTMVCCRWRPALYVAFGTGGAYAPTAEPPNIPEICYDEMFMSSNVNEERNIQTVGTSETLPDNLFRCSTDAFGMGSQVFAHDSMPSSSTDLEHSSAVVVQCLAQFNDKVSDRPNITMGDNRLSQYISTSSHLRRHYCDYKISIV
ncbi:hypothetical protein PHJA_001765000 [Phtheirospermum japonicum]|uniref:Uncharacterized protein n=1 Tax=Phtheirospermum japonicum TaxID=374723 RepID=A0A830CAC4_9LAMI|nr:hypothetical protein PHJA_001765000 [Phtheirospermum japonicum]